MQRQDKYVMVASLVTAMILLYMIKPAQANAFCSDWNSQLFHKSIKINYEIMILDNDSSEEFFNKVNEEYEVHLRDRLIWTVACSDVTMFF